MKQTTTGFSLIELMVAVAILGIITAIAIPSYQSFILKSHRSEAHTALLDISARQEEYYSENKKYTDDVRGLKLPWTGQYYLTISANGHYQIYVALLGTSGQEWVATAKPLGSQVADIHCFRFKSDGNKLTLQNDTTNGCSGAGSTPGWE